MSRRKKHSKRKNKRHIPSFASFWPRVRMPLALIGIALIPRLLVLLELRSSPIFVHPVIDAQTYHELAKDIANGNLLGYTTFWQAPLYPYFLGLIYWMFGISIMVAKLIQALLSAANCFLIFKIAERTFDRRVGWVAYVMSAIYGPAIFFATELLAATLLNFLILLSLLLLLSYHRNTKPMKTALIGVLLGLAQIGHGLVVAFLPVLIVWLYFFQYKSDKSFRPALKASGILIAGFLSLILITTIRNYAVDHEFTPVSANFGANFYLGNHPNYDSTTAIRPGLEWDEFIQEAAANGHRTPAQSSSYFSSKALDNIEEHPGALVGLIVKKLYLLTAGDEIKRNLDIYHFKSYSLLLNALIWRYVIAFPTGIILPLALVWLVMFFIKQITVPQKKEIWLLLLFMFSQAAAILLFFVSTRYRLTIMPVAIILASAMIVYISELARRAGSTKLILPVALLIVFLIYCNIPRVSASARNDAENLFYEGLAFAHENDCRTAIERYKAALDLYPNYAMAEYNMAVCYGKLKQTDLAEQHLDSLVARNPDSFMARLVAGTEETDLGNNRKAEALFKQVLDMNPNSAEALINLGEIYRQRKDSTGALTYLRRALQIDPKAYKAYNQMGAVYMDAKQIDLAERYFNKAYDIDKSYAKALINLGYIYSLSGRLSDAERTLEKAVKIDPTDITGLLNYGATKLKMKEPREALELFDRAVAIAPDAPQTHHYRGIALLSLRQDLAAKREFQRALQLDPNFTPSREQLEKMGY